MEEHELSIFARTIYDAGVPHGVDRIIAEYAHEYDMLGYVRKLFHPWNWNGLFSRLDGVIVHVLHGENIYGLHLMAVKYFTGNARRRGDIACKLYINSSGYIVSSILDYTHIWDLISERKNDQRWIVAEFTRGLKLCADSSDGIELVMPALRQALREKFGEFADRMAAQKNAGVK